MARKDIRIIIIIHIFSLIIIFSTPIVIFSISLSSYSRIDESFQFYYNSGTPSFYNKLNIDIDIGEVKIEYITDPVSYYAKLNINIEMVGQDLVGKSHLDYFDIFWQNASTFINFTMKLKADIDQSKVLSMIKKIDVIVALKADIIFNINILVDINGDVRAIIPFGVSIGDLLTNTTKGDIQYDFFYCFLEGNVTAIIQNAGDIKVRSYDVEYRQNSNWSLYTNNGDIFIEISQNKATNANITGNITIITGNYLLTYRDNTAEVGAYFILHVHPDDYAINQKVVEFVGFAYNVFAVNGTDVYHITSDDYPSLYNYQMVFDFPIGIYKELELQNY